MKLLLDPRSPIDTFERLGGGKALGLRRVEAAGAPVPPWFCVSTDAFDAFVDGSDLRDLRDGPASIADVAAFAREAEARIVAAPLPAIVRDAIAARLREPAFADRFVAVRSSGVGEDAPRHSFAGQFSTFLYRRGEAAIVDAIKRCWASGLSERVLRYRLERGLPTRALLVGVVVQRMLSPEVSGVVFSRDPVDPTARDRLVVSAVWGLGEGLVSGALDADRFDVSRGALDVTSAIVDKPYALRAAPSGDVERVAVPEDRRRAPTLRDDEVRAVADLALRLERALGAPQDCEWAVEAGALWCLQTRAITNLPPDAFFDARVRGDAPKLWDSSNIVESYGGVTTPLTFSFASNAYRQVYVQFCEVLGVPASVIAAHEATFRNMLGLVRGRIYYDLASWYRLVGLLPGSRANASFMETMMGVKQALGPDLAGALDLEAHAPRYTTRAQIALAWKTWRRFRDIDRIVGDFQRAFDAAYQRYRRTDFRARSLSEQIAIYHELDARILRRWQAPIINDYLVMVFFGLLKKLTAAWVARDGEAASLQNDLLCGRGDLESAEPTKALMRMAEAIDAGDAGLRAWVVSASAKEVSDALRVGAAPKGIDARAFAAIADALRAYLDRFGFRCVDELKLESPDLHDDPTFVVDAVAGYVRRRGYSIAAMEARERAIADAAEEKVRARLDPARRAAYLWVLARTREAVRRREELRFDRTKIFGVARHLFRGVGANLARLGVLASEGDVFYLTVDEIVAFVEGRAVSNELGAIAEARRAEVAEYRRTPAPPDRLLTRGAVGASLRYAQVLARADLLPPRASGDDPRVLHGTPCCPGVVEGAVRVVHDIADAEGLDGEILVTERTDPGWVPLYPSCSGLLVERGSLLSHSAVVARELGLPTIVGVTGGLTTRLKTGDRVRVDAARGDIELLPRAAGEVTS